MITVEEAVGVDYYEGRFPVCAYEIIGVIWKLFCPLKLTIRYKG